MYLTCCLIESNKKVISRHNLPTAASDNRPDIVVDDGSRKIWIEAVAPTSGEPSNLNSVPELITKDADDEEFTALEEKPEPPLLRITSALKSKSEQLSKYRDQGRIRPEDLSIIAINGGQIDTSFFVDDVWEAARAVYPIGDQYVRVRPRTGEVVESGRAVSLSIPKLSKGGDTYPYWANRVSGR